MAQMAEQKPSTGHSLSPSASVVDTFFSTPTPLLVSSFLLRAILLLYGLWQDAVAPVKYTDIDYLVFTDAATFTSQNLSPYDRETYRYTPLLAWILLPTSPVISANLPFGPAAWFSFGKVLFASADIVAGILLLRILALMGVGEVRARKFAAIWLLNPMVATISTRGSSEGLLGVLVAALLWAVLEKKTVLAGLLLGLGVHFKIYPFIYATAIVWWMDAERMASSPAAPSKDFVSAMKKFVTADRLTLTIVSLAVFGGLNAVMYYLYGHPFLQHTFLHHVTRIDHRHNFSPYNILLYLVSAFPPSSSSSILRIESVAFVPQILLSTFLIPLICAKKDLATTMLAQTIAFVTFNKVCTSQYFLWYMIFLPVYLPNSSLVRKPMVGISALCLWIGSQAAWLQRGYELEFLGNSTFVPSLWISSLCFFLVNCYILGIVIDDTA